jgi:hypothetical protein
VRSYNMYKKSNNLNGEFVSIVKLDSNLHIPLDPANTDYQAYLKWLDEGNTPEPAEETQ